LRRRKSHGTDKVGVALEGARAGRRHVHNFTSPGLIPTNRSPRPSEGLAIGLNATDVTAWVWPLGGFFLACRHSTASRAVLLPEASVICRAEPTRRLRGCALRAARSCRRHLPHLDLPFSRFPQHNSCRASSLPSPLNATKRHRGCALEGGLLLAVATTAVCPGPQAALLARSAPRDQQQRHHRRQQVRYRRVAPHTANPAPPPTSRARIGSPLEAADPPPALPHSRNACATPSADISADRLQIARRLALALRRRHGSSATTCMIVPAASALERRPPCQHS